jgi:hypothetical protein
MYASPHTAVKKHADIFSISQQMAAFFFRTLLKVILDGGRQLLRYIEHAL